MRLRFLSVLLAAMGTVAASAGAPQFVSERGHFSGELGTQLNTHMESAEQDGFSGALLVERKGEVVIAAGYGWANQAETRRFTKDTVFDIGSITKQFTAAAVLKLQEAGKLNVNDRMAQYIPNTPRDKEAITLHQLLTHTSGMKDVFGGDYDRCPRDLLIERALASELLWAPGTKYRYSNSGYSLLGAIVEIVSGQGYEQYLQDALLRTAGMTMTGYVIPNWDRDSVVHWYRNGKDAGSPLDQSWLPDGPGWNLRCNGGILSTLDDLRKWHHALLGESVLSKESKRLAFSRHTPESERGVTHYGYGWSIAETVRGTNLITHNGGNDFFTTDFRRYVDEEVLVLMTASVAEKRLEPREREVLKLVFPATK